MKLRVKFHDGRKRVLEVREWSNIHDVKNLIKGVEGIAPERQRLFFRGREVDNSWCVASAEDGCTLFCVIKPSDASQRYAAKINLCASSSTTAKRLRECLLAAQRGLSLNLKPLLAVEGLGGTYFLRDNKKQCVACFKPQDEEPGGINNPRGLVGVHGQVAQERGIKAGEACAREMAAYLLDHGQFAGVPATAMAEASHHSFNHSNGKQKPKLGMLQEYVVHDDVAGDLSPDLFSVNEVHKIGILDIRCVNTDRNEGNILVRYGQDKTEYERKDGFTHSLPKWRQVKRSAQNIKLVPIDHGYCFPKTFNIGWCDWCWLGWKQTLKPFDKETLKYISKLDPDADIERLRKETDIPRECLRNSKIATILLKQGAAAGLVLYDIADIMSRSKLDRPSDLEEAVARANAMAKAFLKSPRARGYFGSDMKRRESNKSPMLSPSSQTVSGDSLTTGKSKSSNDVVSTLSPIQRHVENAYLEADAKLIDKHAHESSINRNLMNAFEMSPIHGSRIHTKDGELDAKQKCGKIERALTSMVLSPVEERGLNFGSETEEKSSIMPVPESKILRRKSSNLDLADATTDLDFDAGDEGDDEQEDNDVMFDTKAQRAATSTSFTASPSSTRRKSMGNLSKPPTTSTHNRGSLTERKAQKMPREQWSQLNRHKSRSRPSMYDASPIICPSQFQDISNGVEETKTRTSKGHDDGQEVKETAPREASCAFKKGRSAASGITIYTKANNASNGFDKSPKRPRRDSFCASDDETFLRSPARRGNENSNSSDASPNSRSSSPKSTPSSPMGPTALTRTFSYSEAMFSLPRQATYTLNSAPRTLRSRRSGDNLEAVYGDLGMFEKCFFGYLEKLINDLISFRLRARKVKQGKEAHPSRATSKNQKNEAPNRSPIVGPAPSTKNGVEQHEPKTAFGILTR